MDNSKSLGEYDEYASESLFDMEVFQENQLESDEHDPPQLQQTAEAVLETANPNDRKRQRKQSLQTERKSQPKAKKGKSDDEETPAFLYDRNEDDPKLSTAEMKKIKKAKQSRHQRERQKKLLQQANERANKEKKRGDMEKDRADKAETELKRSMELVLQLRQELDDAKSKFEQLQTQLQLNNSEEAKPWWFQTPTLSELDDIQDLDLLESDLPSFASTYLKTDTGLP